jgi:hypothetical protein
VKFFDSAKQKPADREILFLSRQSHRKILFFGKSQMRMSINSAQIHANNWFYSMTWVGGGPPLGRCREGVSFACCLLVVCLLFDRSTARKMPYTPQDSSLCCSLAGASGCALTSGAIRFAGRPSILAAASSQTWASPK